MKNFGKTGIKLSRLGIGGHTFLSSYGGTERADRKELESIVVTAIDKGINLFDVTYDEERQLLGSILKELKFRDKVFLTCWMSGSLTTTASDVKNEAHRAVEMLRADHVDLLYLDWTCTPEQAGAMTALRDEGIARFIGVLGTETVLSCRMDDFDAARVNHNYYLREKETDIKEIRTLNPHLGIISLEPIGRGRFALDKAPAGISMAAACLKYSLNFTQADAVLAAVRPLSELKDNIRTWKEAGQLSEIERGALSAGRGYETAAPI